jgi:hypothetical protein
MALPSIQVHVAPGCDAGRLARLGQGLLQKLEAEPTHDAVLVVAELTGDTALLGRHQRFTTAIAAPHLGALTPLRRSGGGRTLSVGQGTLGVLFAVPQPGVLLQSAVRHDRFINRYVRGLLAGLTRLGAPGGAGYFGRDFIACQSQQLAVVSQDNLTRAALLEAHVAIDLSLQLPTALNHYPAHGDPRAGGPPHTTLAALRGRTVGLDEATDAIARSYASTFACLAARKGEPDWAEAPLEPVHEDEEGWSDSGVCDIPIGFAEGLARHEGGVVTGARLRGDFMAPAFLLRQLEQAMAGAPLDFNALGARVNAAFQETGGFSLGLSDLRVLADAILVASGVAV